MDEILLQKLIDLVQTASPVVWEAAMRRVYVVVIADLVWGAVLFACAYYLALYARSKNDEWYSDDSIRYIVYFGIGLLSILGGLVVTSGLMWLGSPTYSAIKFLLDLP